MKEITTFAQLCEWLSENDYFTHGHVLSIDYDPLSITVGNSILSYTLVPKNLLEWSIPNGFIPTEESFIEGLEAIEMEGGVALKSSSPNIRIIAKSFKISNSQVIQIPLKSWVSGKNQVDCAEGD